MFRYLELCVDLKKSHVAKEGLFQYRNMCQSTNVASLASVVQGYLNMAEKRTESARQESADSVEVSKIYSTDKKEICGKSSPIRLDEELVNWISPIVVLKCPIIFDSQSPFTGLKNMLIN